jgi:hypothetical protein
MTIDPLRFRDHFTRAISLCWAALREIFDESAYARFLARQQAISSPETYATFLREQAAARSRRHRCC